MRRLIQWLPRGPIAATAAVFLLLLVVLAIVAPLLWTDASTATDVLNANKGSSAAHPFGTDRLGRDILYRTLVATQLSLVLAVIAAVIGICIGVPLGVLPALFGQGPRRFIAAIIGGAIALPGLLLALFVNTILGVGATGAVLGIGIANAPVLARLAQTLSASVATRDYISSAWMLGASRSRLLFRHILPNIAEPLILTGTMSVGWCLLEISALSFLGLGVRPPDYDWGALLNQGLQSIYVNPWSALGPALFVVVSGLAFALLGESLSAVARRSRSMKALRPTTATAGAATADPGLVLDVAGLTVQFPGTGRAALTAVAGVEFALRRGERVGIVGESGSGKSQTALAIAQLVMFPGSVGWQRLVFDGTELATASAAVRRELLGTSLALVSQDPMTALNPALRVGRQLAEVAEVHGRRSRRQANALAIERLGHVQISDPARRARQFPFEFSGGMRQRAVIAMGLMASPKLIIADEPTTALDVTVQKQVLDLLERVGDETGAALLLISHDVAVVTNTCSRVIVMYGGRIVEDIGSEELLAGAAHPYSRMLIAAVPTMTTDRGQELSAIGGRPPTLDDMPTGCPFAPRCPRASARCTAEMPPLEQVAPGHRLACWHPVEGALEEAVA